MKNILIILEATLGGTRKHVVDILYHINLQEFNVTFCYSLIRADKNFLIDLEKIKDRGINCVEIPMWRNINLIKDFYSFLKIYNLISRGNFEVVHLHSSKAGFLGRVATKLVSRKIKTIYTPNSLAININRLYKYLEKIASVFTDLIIAVSESEEKEIIAAKLNCKIIRINSGVKYYSVKKKSGLLRRELNINDDIKIILSIGRLSKQKDPLTFFNVAKHYLDKQGNRNVIFIWVGDGELRSTIEDYVSNNNIFNNCKILGWRTDIEELLWDADIFVLTSIYESFGYVTCEAMAHFLPVIATNVVGTKDIVVDCETGFLVYKGDYNLIVQKIDELIHNENLRQNMGINGNKRINEHFNVVDMVKNLENLYKQF